MNALISIELKLRKDKIYKYLLGALCCCLFSIICTYVFALTSKQEEIFSTYEALLKISAAVNIVCFSVLASVMYSQFIVEEYSGKKLLLLFTYPISRKKWMLTKVIIVAFFITMAAGISQIINWSIYFSIESFFPILDDTLTIKLFIHGFITLILSLLIIAFSGLISLSIGMHFKTPSSIIISSTLVSSFIANSIIATLNNYIGYILSLCITIILGAFLLCKLLNKVNFIEIE